LTKTNSPSVRATSATPCVVRCGCDPIRARITRANGRVSTRLAKPSVSRRRVGVSGTNASQITSRQYPNCSPAGRAATSHTAMSRLPSPEHPSSAESVSAASSAHGEQVNTATGTAAVRRSSVTPAKPRP